LARARVRTDTGRLAFGRRRLAIFLRNLAEIFLHRLLIFESVIFINQQRGPALDEMTVKCSPI